MSRDPLEGFRPQDTAEPGIRPHDALDRPSVNPPSVVQPARRSGIKVAVLIIGAAFAVFGGVLAFYLTAHPSPRIPRSTPTATAKVTPTPIPTGEAVVRQGPAPSDESSPSATK